MVDLGMVAVVRGGREGCMRGLDMDMDSFLGNSVGGVWREAFWSLKGVLIGFLWSFERLVEVWKVYFVGHQ